MASSSLFCHKSYGLIPTRSDITYKNPLPLWDVLTNVVNPSVSKMCKIFSGFIRSGECKQWLHMPAQWVFLTGLQQRYTAEIETEQSNCPDRLHYSCQITLNMTNHKTQINSLRPPKSSALFKWTPLEKLKSCRMNSEGAL